MPKPEQAVGGSDEPIIAAEPTLEDRMAAAMGLPDEEEEQADAPESESPDAPEDPEIEIDEADEGPEPIKAPLSWPEEKKAMFADLPREVQETIAERETEREKFIQAKSREAKQAEQAARSQALEQIQGARELHMQQLQALLPQIPQKPSAHLQYQDPENYAYAMDAHEQAVAQHNWIVQQLDQIGGEYQQAHQQARIERETESLEILQEHLPEYFDQSKGAELRKTLASTAADLGYSSEAIANVQADDVLALNKAAAWKAKAEKYDALMSKQMAKVREAKKLPTVSKPGVSRGKGALANERYTRDRQAMLDGDRDAATRVFARFAPK